MNIFSFLTILNSSFVQNNGKLYFIGGASREIINNKNLPNDLDFSTDLNPDKVQKILEDLNKIKNFNHDRIFLKIITIGKEFGTISLFLSLKNEIDIFTNYSVEITTTRKDINCFGRGAKVEFCTDFKIDSGRRDFTINAVYVSLDSFLKKKDKLNIIKNLEILDFHDGISHLKKKRIIFIGDAQKRIEEDYLRIIRYIRFCTLFKCKIDFTIKKLILNNLENLKQISKERKRKEIYTILSYKNYQFGLINLIKCQIFDLKINSKLKNSQKNCDNLFLRLINFIFINSNHTNFVKNLIYLKENFIIEKEEVKIANFYIQNTKIINLFLNKNYKELITTNVSLKFRKTFANFNRNDYLFFSTKKNWIEFINFVNKYNIFKKEFTIKNINTYIKVFFINFYLNEFVKDEFYFEKVIQNNKKFSFLIKKKSIFTLKKEKISYFIDKINDKSKIGKFITMCLGLCRLC